MGPSGSFLAFHHVSIAVRDVAAARHDWEVALGWAASADARFDLVGSYLELVPAGDGAVGVVEVGVVVDDVKSLGASLDEIGVIIQRRSDGRIGVERSSINGVPLLLGPADPELATAPTGPFGRISHVVVAVSDLPTAVGRWAGFVKAWPRAATGPGHEISEHIPVGAAWFGLTAAGTNAEAIERFIARSGEGVYAVGLTVDDPAAAFDELSSRGSRMIGGGGTAQTFVHPATTHGLLLAVVAG